MGTVKPMAHTAPKFRKRVVVEFKDDEGVKHTGVMKSNNGIICKILVNSTTYLVSRKQIKYVEE